MYADYFSNMVSTHPARCEITYQQKETTELGLTGIALSIISPNIDE